VWEGVRGRRGERGEGERGKRRGCKGGREREREMLTYVYMYI